MAAPSRRILLIGIMLLAAALNGFAQEAPAGNDTIRLGAVTENGQTYPMVFLDEYEQKGLFIDAATRVRRDKLRRDIYIVYPYALTAAAILKDVNTNLDDMDRRHDRKKYLKTINGQLDKAFKDPLKNLTIDQGHVLIKLISRQTGQNCYSIIRELKGGVSAVVWQSVGVLFNNNLRHEYDPEGKDTEMESIVRVLEASNNYKYQLYQQDQLLKKVGKASVSVR